MDCELPRGQTSWRILNRFYLIAILLNTLNSFTQRLFDNTLTLHLTSAGYGAATSGTLMAVATAGALLYRITGGNLADRFGRRNTLLCGFCLLTAGNLICACAFNLPLLYLGGLSRMIGFSMVGTSAGIMAVDTAPRERMSEAIGYYSLGTTIVSALGPTLALAVYGRYAYRGAMLLAAASGAAGFVLTLFFCGYERRADFPGNRISALRQKPKLPWQCTAREFLWSLIEKSALPAMLTTFCGALGMSIITLYLTHYTSTIGIQNSGPYFSCMAIAAFASRLVSGRLADRKGTVFCAAPGFLMIAVSLLLVPLSAGFPGLLYLSGLLNGFGQGMAIPAMNAAAVRSAPKERQGVASSTFFLQGDLYNMFGAMLWGNLIDLLGYTAVFQIGAGFAVLSIGLILLFFRRK